MRIPFQRIRSLRHDDFLTQHSNVLLASLVTVILVGCSGQVAEEQAVRRPDSETTSSATQPNGASNPVAVANTATGQSAALGDAQNGREPPSTRSSDVRTKPTFRAVDQAQAGNLAMSAEPTVSSSGTQAERRSGSIESLPDAVQVDRLPRSAEYYQQHLPSSEPQQVSIRQLALHSGPEVNRENYLAVDENTVKLVSEQPVSTFSIDVDTAGYSNLRRMIMKEGRLPSHDAVRLEEMINYFSYDYPVPDSLAEPLAIHTEISASPWNPSNRLLMVGIQGFEPDPEARPPSNLVFLVDVSGSMNSPDKLGLVQRSLKLLVDQMRDEDRIALVVYAGAAGMVLDSTPGSEKYKIKHAIDSLRAGGSTNGAAGIQLAYQITERNRIEGGINRVIIASDGDLNVGMTDIDDLKELIGKKRDKGIALTTLGFGTGNYNYSLMEQIADVGNGNAAYIDSLNEARKVLVNEMQSTLMTIAKDVKIQIEFNPVTVKEYRLLGYENRLLNREDFTNDKVDAGEIGAGHTVTALYEITLAGTGSGLFPDRRYGTHPVSADDELAGELAYVKIRHKPADGDLSTEIARAVTLEEDRDGIATSDSFRFAAAVAGFGQLLRGGKYTGNWSYEQALELARDAKGDDPYGYRSELVNLVDMARLL